MTRRWGTLSQRLSLVFAMLLLVCCGASAWLQMRANSRYEQELTQRLSAGLATHIASNAELMRADGLNDAAVRDLFDKLMAVNPSVEVYLLTPKGRIAAQAAPPGHLKAQAVDLKPIQQLLSGAELPILGDDPRSASGQRKVFSAARLQAGGHDAGYVYVVLQGENFAALSARVSADNVLRTTLLSMALVALLCLAAGLAAFALITRPLRRLTEAVRGFEAEGVAAFDRAEPLLTDTRGAGQDIAALGNAFARMAQRIATQWRELTTQDQQRRELFANISHDLRTPLTSLHGYLETLLIKSEALNPQDRRRYLEIALGQSRKVGRLAQELFELARLEYGVVKLDKESLALPDLVQDVFQKFELAAEARHQRLVADIAPGLPTVTADLGLIERVLTNLLDNAIQHTPAGGEITVQLRPAAASPSPSENAGKGGGVDVEISDTGPGVPPSLQHSLFKRPAFSAAEGRSGGLGLVVVQRILALHGSDIALVQRSGKGAVFAFRIH
ncbi:HAMP domain-containing sensor histidine kinase [Acidovorax sp. SUPP3334]|uniref:sensor histidine kinase n=1 Tax=Acidovorax sp. SUPP3334 TaxID=2920881 RepID=UPI0023DE3BE9|nr:HAMP domain-containing sensor histidine kinase [Acidovorax sp. SUPP3334]GKT25822.1 HAMP domain-containing histidine kinase [Acidovorax sp. SUPP3334]